MSSEQAPPSTIVDLTNGAPAGAAKSATANNTANNSNSNSAGTSNVNNDSILDVSEIDGAGVDDDDDDAIDFAVDEDSLLFDDAQAARGSVIGGAAIAPMEATSGAAAAAAATTTTSASGGSRGGDNSARRALFQGPNESFNAELVGDDEAPATLEPAEPAPAKLSFLQSIFGRVALAASGTWSLVAAPFISGTFMGIGMCCAHYVFVARRISK